jgi:hypothetical protein
VYTIEYYKRGGCFILRANRFRTVGQAHRFAKKHIALVGTNYFVIPIVSTKRNSYKIGGKKYV